MENKKNVFLRKVISILGRYNYLLIFAFLIVLSSCISDNFLTIRNIFNLIRQNAGASILAMGMLLVIMTG